LHQPRAGAVGLDDMPDARIPSGETRRAAQAYLLYNRDGLIAPWPPADWGWPQRPEASDQLSQDMLQSDRFREGLIKSLAPKSANQSQRAFLRTRTYPDLP
jgi:hypothetical protein